MHHKQEILEEGEEKQHTLVGKVYEKTSSAVLSTPLLGSAVNTAHGLAKTTLGHVDNLSKKIGLRKIDADSNGVRT